MQEYFCSYFISKFRQWVGFGSGLQFCNACPKKREQTKKELDMGSKEPCQHWMGSMAAPKEVRTGYFGKAAVPKA